jgi:hypothetical protein
VIGNDVLGIGAAARACEEHGADGLSLGAAIRPRNPGDGDGLVGI